MSARKWREPMDFFGQKVPCIYLQCLTLCVV